MNGELIFERAESFNVPVTSPDVLIISATVKRDYKICGKIMDQKSQEPIKQAFIRIAVQRQTGMETLGYTYSLADGSYHFTVEGECLNPEDKVIVYAVRPAN